MGQMDTVGTQQATPTGQIRCSFVAVGVVGKVNDATYQVGYNVDLIIKDTYIKRVSSKHTPFSTDNSNCDSAHRKDAPMWYIIMLYAYH